MRRAHPLVMTLALLLASAALGQGAAPPTTTLEPLDDEAPQEPPAWYPHSGVTIDFGLNVGLFGMSVHASGFYGFLAGNVGVPLLSGGSLGAFAVGAGITKAFAVSDSVVWSGDLYAVALPGWWNGVANATFSGAGSSAFVGAGLGLGLRFAFKGRFTFGLKFPIFGVAFCERLFAGGFASAANSVGIFYMANLVALPLISFSVRL